MNFLEKALHPMSLDDLMSHYKESKCLMLEGAAEKFHQLISPEDIERRLNDGCNGDDGSVVITFYDFDPS